MEQREKLAIIEFQERFEHVRATTPLSAGLLTVAKYCPGGTRKRVVAGVSIRGMLCSARARLRCLATAAWIYFPSTAKHS